MAEQVNFSIQLRYAKIRSLIMVLDSRFGKPSPYNEYVGILDQLGEDHLGELETSLHELVYAPPVRR